MDHKTTILSRIRANKPGPRKLPLLPEREAPQDELRELFTAVLAGSKTRVYDRSALANYVRSNFPDAKTVVSTLPEITGNLDPAAVEDPLQLAGVDLAVLHARLGVAENGAMWVSEREAVQRVLPFITQHLILVLPPASLVPTMHEAYRRVEINGTGFGVFIAGPSKTADIEQSLVIGAHGPRSLAVFLPE